VGSVETRLAGWDEVDAAEDGLEDDAPGWVLTALGVAELENDVTD
jgi:hypothetical protein